MMCVKNFKADFFNLVLFYIIGTSACGAQARLMPVKEALHTISRQFDVRFAYEPSVVDKVQVYFNPNEKKASLEEALRGILKPTGLEHSEMRPRYFVIKKGAVKEPAGEIPEHTKRKSIEKAAVKGRVYKQKTGEAVEMATVGIAELGLFAYTDETGAFVIPGVPEGKYTIKVQSLTTVPLEKTLKIEGGSPLVQADFGVDESVWSLKEVKVVASENKVGGATASTISKTAIEHLQATSLADVMQLLPGGIATNPSLNSVSKVSIRQVNTDNVGSLGTSLIVNGAPVSNNANLQASNTSTAGANASFATTTGAGVDFRQVSADNIESIEVIRGIPSVEYGDLTSGAVIVKTKAGREPFQVKVRINPTLTQLWMGKGMGLGEKKGTLNADLDYTYSVSDQRYNYTSYNRLTASLLYSNRFFDERPLHTTTHLSYGMNIDHRRTDPNDVFMTERRAQDLGFRFSTNGKWNAGMRFSKVLSYTVSANYSVQKGFQQELITSYVYPLSYAMKDTMVVGEYLPSTYLSKLWIDGWPLNIFVKVTNSFFGRTGGLNHRVLAGIEWKYDGNDGKGKTYDLSRPPRMMSGNGFRPRSFAEIPALTQLSFYLEDNIYTRFLDRDAYVQLGLRYDNVQPSGIIGTRFGTIISPRVNASYQVCPDLSVRAGYGITAKAPTLLYLYPQNAYYDLVNLNYFAENPAERLTLITTKVFNTENPDLKLSYNTKKEAGFDWKPGGKRISVTAFHERTTNGYGFSSTIGSTLPMPVLRYGVAETPAGRPPSVNPVPVRTDTLMTDYMVPVNDRLNVNTGVEFDLDMGLFSSIRTSFVLNGAWMKSESSSLNPYVTKLTTSGAESRRVGIFPSGRGTEHQRFNTTLRAIHHIPQVSLVFTFALQTIWLQQDRYINYESRAEGYIDRSTGEVARLTGEERNNLSPVRDGDIYMIILPQYYVTEKWKPLWLLNLRLTKSIGRYAGFSFFANNVLMHRPLEESRRWKGDFTRRNQPLFFGMEMSLKI